VQVRLSRHARRRAQLYEIPEETVLSALADIDLSPGKHEIVANVEGLKFPLKIIVSVDYDIITVISNYPLKKGHRL
jgi:hypothetical protein